MLARESRKVAAGAAVRYGATVLLVGVTYALTDAVGRIVPHFVGDFFYPAIGAVAWFLGAGPALLCVVLSLAAVAILTPETPFPSLDDVLYLLLFAVTALGIVHLGLLQRRARELSEARAREAVDATAAKDRFLDLVSHELRGPLNVIRLWIGILSGDRSSASTLTRASAAIENAVRQQERLVADLLDAARVRTGAVAMQVRPTMLNAVLARAVDAVRPAAEGKGVALVPAEMEVDAPLLADPDRLTQVFWNLLTNAVKFTEPGGRVGIRVVQHADEVETHVWDTGRGLSPEDCHRAFEPYWQQARGDGLGLGLLIARRLVELHGGALSVTSDGDGRGADFVVALPLEHHLAETAANPVRRGVA